MSVRLLLEGPDLQEILGQAREAYGPTVRVVQAEQVRSGGLGGFFLPPLFAYTKLLSGFPTSTFFVIFVLVGLCAAWMHVTIHRMMTRATPESASLIEPELETAS